MLIFKIILIQRLQSQNLQNFDDDDFTSHPLRFDTLCTTHYFNASKYVHGTCKNCNAL